jgi:hypothetical protein
VKAKIWENSSVPNWQNSKGAEEKCKQQKNFGQIFLERAEKGPNS